MAHSYYYQFYYGKVFTDPANYEDRKKKIVSELNDGAKEFINMTSSSKLKENGQVDEDFLFSLKDEIEKSLKEESILYKAVGVESPEYNKNDIEIDSFLTNSYNKISELTRHFLDPSNQGLFNFLSGLNDSKILNSLAGFMTTLSFTKKGGGSREKGKKQLTGSVNKALSKTNALNVRYKEIMEYIWEDFFGNDEVIDLLSSWNGEASTYQKTLKGFKNNSKDLDVIFDVVSAALDKYFGDSKSRIRTKNKSERSKTLNTASGETSIKRFYKQVWSDLCNNFNVNSAERLSQLQEKSNFLGGALRLESGIRSSTYGEKVLMTLYQDNNGVETVNTQATNGQVVDSFIDALKTAYNSVPDYREGLNFINQNTALIKNYILSSYGLKATDFAADPKNAKSIFALFSKSSVSGLLGEIGAAIAFRSKSNSMFNYDAIITGNDIDTSGKKIPTDVQLKVTKIAKTGRVYNPKILNIQVKNYSSKKDRVQLYSETEIGINSNSLSRYTFKGNKNFIKILKFILANYSMISELTGYDINTESIEQSFNLFLGSFLRSISRNDNEVGVITRNSFYYMNNRLVPASYILATAYKQALELVKKSKTLFNISGAVQSPEHISINEKVSNYEPISASLQPKAKKGGVGYKNNKAGRRYHYPIRAYSFELNGERFPREINNLVEGLKLKFKGITVKI